MAVKHALLVVCALSALGSIAAAPLWTNIGPEGGEARSFASDARTNTVFVVNPRSGVFRSAGGPWTLVFDALGRGVTPTRVAVDLQTSRVYVGTTAGLFRSDDEGSNWRVLTTDPIIDITASSDHVIVSTSLIFARSGDAGITWTGIPSPPSDVEMPVSLVRIDPRAIDRVIAVVGGNLFRSDDSANSWQRLTPRNVVAVEFADVMYTGGPDGIYGCDTECTLLGSDPVVDVAYWRGILYGAISDGVLRFPRRERVIDGFPTATVVSLVATPSALLTGTIAGVYQTDDGSRWTSRSQGLTNVRITAISAAAGTVVAATDGQNVLRRSGGTWNPAAGLPPAEKVARTLATDGSTYYAGFPINGIFRSTSQGVSWEDISAGLPSPDVFEVTVDSGLVLAATLGGLARSTDRGITWQRFTSYPAPWTGTVAVKGRTIVAGYVTTALVTTDGGATWSSSELPATIRRVAIAGDRAYAATDQGIFVRTGTAWTPPPSALVGVTSHIKAMTVAGTRLYVSLPSGIYFTDDGVAWMLVLGSDALPPDITALAVDEVFLYAGTNGGSLFATLLTAPRQRSVRH